jgi:hypothetical protein
MLRSTLLATFLIALPAVAQTLNFDFAALAAKATSKTEMNLDGPTLQAAMAAVPAEARGKVDIKALSIHAYEYAKAGDYPTSGLEALRKQAASDSRWSRILSAQEDGESTDIFVMNQDGKVAGFLLIAAEAKEVTVIQAAGSLDLAQLKEVVDSTIHFDLAKLAEAK